MRIREHLKFSKIAWALILIICLASIQINSNNKIREYEKEIEFLVTQYEEEVEKNSELAMQLKEERSNRQTYDIIEYASIVYEVPYPLLMAIMRLETGNFTSQLWTEQNNPGGIKYNGEYATFTSKNIGIIKTAEAIKTQWIDKGMTTPEEIQTTYCPLSDKGCEGWAEKVTAIMKEYE